MRNNFQKKQGILDIGDNNDERPKEVTHLVERLDLLEEKLGILISGLYATVETAHRLDGDYDVRYIKINFDLSSVNGGNLKRDFLITASAYNTAGQLLETTCTYINADRFMGFQSISMNLSSLIQMPEKIRLFPSV